MGVKHIAPVCISLVHVAVLQVPIVVHATAATSSSYHLKGAAQAFRPSSKRAAAGPLGPLGRRPL